jgi:hypothetical protein
VKNIVKFHIIDKLFVVFQLIFILANVFLGVGRLLGCMGVFSMMEKDGKHERSFRP